MIIVYIDNKVIDFTEVGYHFQKEPKPAGYLYKICIELTEIKLIALFEKMLSKKITDTSFFTKAINSGMDSTFNLIRWTLDYMDENMIEKKGK